MPVGLGYKGVQYVAKGALENIHSFCFTCEKVAVAELFVRQSKVYIKSCLQIDFIHSLLSQIVVMCGIFHVCAEHRKKKTCLFLSGYVDSTAFVTACFQSTKFMTVCFQSDDLGGRKGQPAICLKVANLAFLETQMRRSVVFPCH